SYILTGANGKYYGKFVILALNENRSAFVDGSGFVAQSFSMDLERDFDE
ncbi:TPA: phage tail protein, partial [Campylobacter jejuni]|nr:phage tail protein [Campylobacter jejuni]